MNTLPKGWNLVACADGAAVAEHVAACLLVDRLHWPDQPLGLATGRTMEPVYGALVKVVYALPAAEQQRLRQQWLSFNLDEYVGLPTVILYITILLSSALRLCILLCLRLQLEHRCCICSLWTG